MELQTAARTLDQGSEEETQQNAERVPGEAVYAIALVDPVDAVSAAIDTPAMAAKNRAISGEYPTLHPERLLAAPLALIGPRIQQPLPYASMHPDQAAPAGTPAQHKIPPE
jgi:hypothetical protein